MDALFQGQFLDTIKDGDYKQAHTFFEDLVDTSSSVEVHAQFCPSCVISPATLTVSRSDVNAKGQLVLHELL